MSMFGDWIRWIFRLRDDDADATIVIRKEDATYWTPAGDTPYPLTGFNFVPAIQTKDGWRKDMDGKRWVFYDGSLFQVVRWGRGKQP